MRLLTALIGYVSTATVLSAAMGLGYLWQTQRLDDEKVFRIMAIVHDVDIQGLKSEKAQEESGIPEEEPSLDDVGRYRSVIARNYEVQQDALKKGRQLYDQSYNAIKEEMRRLNETIQEIESKIEQEGELSSKEAITKVVRDLQLLAPEEAKDLLLLTLDQPDGMNDVILLMNAMATGKLKNILKKFKSDEELAQLHEIHKTMLSGGAQQEMMNEALEHLKNLEAKRR